MSQRGVPVVHRSALGDLQESFKPTRHFWFCTGQHKQAKRYWACWFHGDGDSKGRILWRVFVWKESFLSCCKSKKANVGILIVQSSSLSSLGRCSEISRCLQRAEQDCKWEERPQGESKTLTFRSAAVYPRSNRRKLIPCLEDEPVWKEACYGPGERIVLTYLPSLLYFSLWCCWGAEQNVSSFYAFDWYLYHAEFGVW